MAERQSAPEICTRLADAANDDDDGGVAAALAGLSEVPAEKRQWAINETDEDGETVLHAVARGCYGEAVKQLITWGADVNAVAGDGDTALANALWAQRWKDNEAAALALIAAGADVAVRDRFELMPLHHAAATGSLAMVEALIAAGADVMVLDGREGKETPLHLAAQDGNAEVIPALLGAAAQVDQLNSDEVNELFLAAQYGHLAVVQALIAAGCGLDVADGMERTAAIFAAYNGDEDILAELRAAGARMDAQDVHGLTVADILAAFDDATGDRKTRLTVFMTVLLQNASGGADFSEASFLSLYHENDRWTQVRFERLCQAIKRLSEGRSYDDPLPRVVARLCHDVFEYLVVAVTSVVSQGKASDIAGIDPDELYDQLDEFKLAYIQFLNGQEGFPDEISAEGLVAQEMAIRGAD